MRFNFGEAAIKNTNALLICSFCMLVLAKALLSINFQSPWIMPDEVSYAKMAGDIFGSVHSDLSRGYPLLLSIAYLSSGDMNVVYHSMLLINCFLSSLILFPSYFILNKYCPKDFSFLGAMAVATLPSLTLYTFLIMTENLFIPIFIFSIWFLLEAYEKEKPIWIFLAILSVTLLFFTRHTGIFMVISMAFSLIHYLLFGVRQKYLKQLVSGSSALTIFTAFTALFLAISGLVLSISHGHSYLKWMYDRTSSDSQIFLTLFTDFRHLKTYLALLQNEMGYMIVVTYFIFSVLSLMFFLNVFLPLGRRCISPSFLNWYKSLRIEKKHSLKSTSIYFLLTSVVLILTTTMYVYRLNWEIIGRYIDPIIPGLFLFGLIALYQIDENFNKRNFGLIVISAIIFSAAFFLNFPASLLPDQIAVFYINFLTSRAPDWMIFPALAAGFFLLLYIYFNFKKNRLILFTALMIVSVCASAYTYQQDLVFISETNHAQNQIGAFLNMHSNSDNLPILMDMEDSKRDWYFASLTKFWTKKTISNCNLNETLLDLEDSKKNAYLITSKVLPLEPLAVSTRGFYLYRF